MLSEKQKKIVSQITELLVRLVAETAAKPGPHPGTPIKRVRRSRQAAMAMRQAIMSELASGATPREIAARYQVTTSYISVIRTRMAKAEA